MESPHVAIIGFGPRGLSVLERILAFSGQYANRSFVIHLIEPNELATGAHRSALPSRYLQNLTAKQTSIFPDATCADAGPVLEGPNLFQWAKTNGYGWNERGEFVRGGSREVGEDDYLPRNVLGEYLWTLR